MTYVSTFIFQGLFKNRVFRSVALVIKKLWAIIDFYYTLRTFYHPLPHPMHKKIKTFYGDSVKNESARAKQKTSLFKVENQFTE